MDRREFLTAAAAAVAAGAVLKTEGSAHAQDAAQAAPKAKWKKAVKYSMLPSKMTDEERLTLAKECGFDGVEGSPTADLDAAAKLAELGRKIGVPFHGLVQDGWSNPLSDP